MGITIGISKKIKEEKERERKGRGSLEKIKIEGVQLWLHQESVVRFLIKLLENHRLYVMILLEIIHTPPNYMYRASLNDVMPLLFEILKRNEDTPCCTQILRFQTPFLAAKASRFPLVHRLGQSLCKHINKTVLYQKVE